MFLWPKSMNGKISWVFSTGGETILVLNDRDVIEVQNPLT